MHPANPFKLFTRYSVGVQIGIAVFGALVLVLASAVVSGFSIGQIGAVQSHLLERQLPRQRLSLQVSRQASELVSLLPRITGAQDLVYLSVYLNEYEQVRKQFVQAIERLGAAGEPVEVLNLAAGDLAGYANELADLSKHRLRAQRALLTAQDELVALELLLDQKLTQAVDDQLFFVMTGMRTLDKPALGERERHSVAELERLHQLSEVQSHINGVFAVLAAVGVATDPAHLQPLRERYLAGMSRVNQGGMFTHGPRGVDAVWPEIGQLEQLAVGHDGVFALADTILRNQISESDVVDKSRAAVRALVDNIDQIIVDNTAQAQVAMAQASGSISAGYVVVGSFAALCFLGALAYGWFYVRNILTQRLIYISSAMHTMAEGDLTQSLEVYGRDEISRMAKSLEVFRRQALAAQRLNLVEKLAEELEQKNNRLRDTVGQLNRAQEQIVLREKLAALGELTAGVAHEIKNPLNFVNNFSDSSIDLCGELLEVVGELELSETSDEYLEIKEILDMLRSNMEKISGHGQRANRIVNSMLSLGRTAEGEASTTELVALVREHAALAWHSVRAAFPDFTGEVVYDVPQDPVVANVVAHDISRVVLNLVTNACHACWERQKSHPGDYQPQIRVSVAQVEDWLEVRVEDNGVGMREFVREQIFNPFFTTKDTDVGTGLGLSISFDLVQSHKGEMFVESTYGRGSTFGFKLPANGQPG